MKEGRGEETFTLKNVTTEEPLTTAAPASRIRRA